MTKHLGKLATAAFALAAAVGVADAHELACTKLVNGQSMVTIDKYPATLQYTFTVRNTHPTDASDVLGVLDAMLGSGWSFDPKPPFQLPVGGSATSSATITINRYEDCQRLAYHEPYIDGGSTHTALMNTLHVKWDLGAAQCSALVMCKLPLPPPPPDPPPPWSPTRDAGFWKTHELALGQCLAGGPVELGATKVATLPEALDGIAD